MFEGNNDSVDYDDIDNYDNNYEIMIIIMILLMMNTEKSEPQKFI